jgi:hypothetical protein
MRTHAPRLTRPLAAAALGILVLSTFHAALALTGVGDGPRMLEDRVLLDTDSYMWMNRVLHIHETGDWFDHTYPRINPPEGHEQHWTRPLDGLLFAGGATLGMVWGFEEGLYYWGLALPPILHVFAFLALIWAVQVLVRRGLFDARHLPLLMLVFLAQIPIHQTFLVGRPDHHALLGLLFVFYLGFWMRVLLEPGRKQASRAAVGLGAVSSLALWVNLEALLYVTLGMVGMGLSWLLGNRGMARLGTLHAGALLIGLVCAVLVEWGPLLPPLREMDTLSVAHLVLMGLTTGFWAVLWGVVSRRVPEIGVRKRALVASAAATGVLGLLLVTFPEFFGSPLGDVDPLYDETRLSKIRELQSVASIGSGFVGGFGAILLHTGIGFLALPYAGGRAVGGRAREERLVWCFLFVMVALYLGLSLHQRRWTDYLALASLLPFAALASASVRRLEGSRPEVPLRVTRPVVLLGFIAGPAVLGLSLMAMSDTDRSGGGSPLPLHDGWAASQEEASVRLPAGELLGEEGRCSLLEVGALLNDPEWFPMPELILAHTDYGPELLYRTRHSVLSIPNHREQPGYRLTREILGHSDHEEAARMLRDRGVGGIVLCSGDITTGFFRFPDAPEPFVEWLARGGVPDGYILHAASPLVRIYRRERSSGSG